MSTTININTEDLLKAGVHFGHLKKKWNPKMAPYIFMTKNKIHIIDLNKTYKMLENASSVVKQLAKSNKKILFVATKKQAKDIVREEAIRANMPYVTERWLGGMLTNFSTVRKSIKKMANIEKMQADGTFEHISKKERLMLIREKAKLERVLKGIENLKKLPAAIFVVDIQTEHLAIKEATRLNIPIIGMVDTNSDPKLVDFAIPSNDDASKSIKLITSTIVDSMIEGFRERQAENVDSAEEVSETVQVSKEETTAN